MSGIEFVGVLLGMTSSLGRLISALREEHGNLQTGQLYSRKLSAMSALLDEINTMVTNADAPPKNTAEILLRNCQHELTSIEFCYTGSHSNEPRVHVTTPHIMARPSLLDHDTIDHNALRNALCGFESSVTLLHNILSHTEMHRQLSDLQMQHQQNSWRMEYLIRAKEHDASGRRTTTPLASNEVSQVHSKLCNEKKPLKVTGGMLDGFLVHDISASRIETTLAQLKNLRSGGAGQADLGQAIASLERASEMPSFIPVRFLVDTGSDVNIVSQDFINRNSLSGLMQHTSPKSIIGASRDMVTQSTSTIELTWRHKAGTTPRTDIFHVLENSTYDAVLGRPFWNDIEFHIMHDTTVWAQPVESRQVNAAKLSFVRKPKKERKRNKREERELNEEAEIETKRILAETKFTATCERNPPPVTPHIQGSETIAETSVERPNEPDPLTTRPLQSPIIDEPLSLPRSLMIPRRPSRTSLADSRASIVYLELSQASSETVAMPQEANGGTNLPSNDEHVELRRRDWFRRYLRFRRPNGETIEIEA